MSRKSPPKFDEIGYWSEVKLDIVREYAQAYSAILSAQTKPSFSHAYIDGFAGSGVQFSKTSGSFVLGSPLNALLIEPPFDDYYFIDLDGLKADALRQRVAGHKNVHVFEGDCNRLLLLEKVFPKVQYKDYRRGLCLLDPYGLHLNWEVIRSAGEMQTIDMFLNFPVMDMNRNTLWRTPSRVEEQNIERMNAFWGDAGWRKAAYKTERGLFDNIDVKEGNKAIAKAFQERLKKTAKFAAVPDPLPMRNSKGAVVYYLFFASQKHVPHNIVTEIFKKHAHRASR